METLLLELTQEIRSWPETVRKLRRKAPADAPFWQEATILLDDPRRLPPDWDQEQAEPLPT